jgi:hypothetical protein
MIFGLGANPDPRGGLTAAEWTKRERARLGLDPITGEPATDAAKVAQRAAMLKSAARTAASNIAVIRASQGIDPVTGVRIQVSSPVPTRSAQTFDTSPAPTYTGSGGGGGGGGGGEMVAPEQPAVDPAMVAPSGLVDKFKALGLPMQIGIVGGGAFAAYKLIQMLRGGRAGGHSKS